MGILTGYHIGVWMIQEPELVQRFSCVPLEHSRVKRRKKPSQQDLGVPQLVAMDWVEQNIFYFSFSTMGS